jgi:hypothetical protein
MGKLETVDRRVVSFMRIERRAVVFWLIYGAAGFVLWLVFGVWVPGCQSARKMATCKQNLHAIQLGLERYAVDDRDECYPPTIQVLVDEGYLDGLPLNAFTGQPMRAIKPGERRTRGDFSYQPMDDRSRSPIPPGNPENVEIDSYLLTLY